MKSSVSSALLLLAGVGGSVACDAPDVNGKTVGVIKQLEGFRADLYDDGYGTQHVGYGHACKQKDCAELSYPIPISEANAEKLLVKDLRGAEGCVTDNVDHSVTLNANQYGALVSFTFNVGCGQFRTSTLIKRLNRGEKPSKVVAEELPKWNIAGGKVAPGLVERRKKEIALFDTATSAPALPACDEPTSTPTSTPTPTPTSTPIDEPTTSGTEKPPTSTNAPEPTTSGTEEPPTNTSTAGPGSTGSESTGPSNSSAQTSSAEPTRLPPTSSQEPQPTGSTSCVTEPTMTTVSKPAGGSTGTNGIPQPTCAGGNCVPISNDAKKQVGSFIVLAAAAAVLF